jgi:hypothetical protein
MKNRENSFYLFLNNSLCSFDPPKILSSFTTLKNLIGTIYFELKYFSLSISSYRLSLKLQFQLMVIYIKTYVRISMSDFFYVFTCMYC